MLFDVQSYVIPSRYTEFPHALLPELYRRLGPHTPTLHNNNRVIVRCSKPQQFLSDMEMNVPRCFRCCMQQVYNYDSQRERPFVWD